MEETVKQKTISQKLMRSTRSRTANAGQSAQSEGESPYFGRKKTENQGNSKRKVANKKGSKKTINKKENEISPKTSIEECKSEDTKTNTEECKSEDPKTNAEECKKEDPKTNTEECKSEDPKTNAEEFKKEDPKTNSEECNSEDIEDIKSPKNAKWEPKNWLQIVENLRTMRSESNAPVDTMGCHKCADDDADEKTQRYHKLVALMLSSQTKDQVTFDAMARLKEKGLTPQNIANIKTAELENLLKPVSFYKNKAKYLQNTAQILIDQYEEDIPNNVAELIKLPGVGPKMAHICMNTAWGVVSGIGVDVHVHRISNRLGWVRKPTKDPEGTRNELESWIPSNYWSELNHLLVGFGQTICTAQNPKCNDCLNKNICPSANIKKEKIKKSDK